ncbi:flagellar protein FlgN [Paenibacillus profundus]|uniref:Flagellar protein FlgN n=1 Tax=Paenibacillus profundus TaxID=1173085 RepID=A0ABS8YFJ3_9BACL|nr:MULTISPECIES: flagellar protein FlgN [Paenibacillus]MCE5169300.1 flagellar protein FlgN [Paenibacillus profundus]MCM3338729.1 flagellar protein FlgN [Paenibacillus sp. MER TA 81-3]
MSASALIDVLSRMETVYQQLESIGEAKTQVIIQNDIKELVRLSNQESKWLKGLSALEEEREEAVYAFLQSKGIKSKLKLTLTEIMKLVFDAQERTQMMAVQERIAATLQRLKQVNDHNQTLIEQSLHFVEYQLNLFIDYSEQDMLYHRPEQPASSYSRPGMLDTRA